jgi:hypothetical protein
MFKRTILATAAACALAVGIQAQEGATIVLRSGEKVTGQLVDMGGAGFAVRVNGQDRNIGTNDVAVIDFTGNGDLSDADWAKVTSGQAILLRNGQTVSGQLYDIGGTSPLRISFKTDGGDREFASNEVGRIVLARPSAAVATTGSNTANTPGIPGGQGIAVSGTQQWTPSGIIVRRGDALTFNTTGEVRLGADAADMAQAAGANSQRMSPNAPMPNVAVGALIGRIGTGAPFVIGNQSTITAPASGQLFLGINDDHVADNGGGFRVNIQRPTRR